MKTYNVELDFNNEKAESYWRTLLLDSTVCWNACSTMVWNNKDVGLGLADIHNLCYYQLREAYPNIPAQGVSKIYKDVAAAYRTNKRKFFATKSNPSLHLDKRLSSHLLPDSICLCGGEKNKRVKVGFKLYPKFVEMASKYTMHDPLIFYRDGRLFLSVPFDTPERPVQEETHLGVDLGIKRVFTTSDGQAYKGTDINARKRRLRYIKRKLRAKGTLSAKRHLRKLRRKERNINKAWAHAICNQILSTDKTIIVLEDLKKLKQRTSREVSGFKRKRHNNRIVQIPIYQIRQILEYKAPLLGKRVATVSPSCTSQINSLTGKKDGIRRGCRYYTPDGLVLDADWNAAINIRNRYAKHLDSSSLPLDGRLDLLSRVHSTTQTARNS